MLVAKKVTYSYWGQEIAARLRAGFPLNTWLMVDWLVWRRRAQGGNEYVESNA